MGKAALPLPNTKDELTMTIFDVLTMIGGLCLFLFGMTIMGANIGTTVTT